MKFTVEETNLMCIYGTESRTGLITVLSEMQEHLQADETELQELTTTVITKLNAMSNDEFEGIKEEFVADFE